jgi:hypothetical protein
MRWGGRRGCGGSGAGSQHGGAGGGPGAGGCAESGAGYHSRHSPPPRRGRLLPTGGAEASAYLRGLRVGEFTTYVHPIYGFSFAYPTAFQFFCTRTAQEDEIYVRHPSLPLGVEITVRPMMQHEDLVAWLVALADEYEAAPPDRAASSAMAWMELDSPYPGQHTQQAWFAHQGELYAIEAYAPDPELLQRWMPEILHSWFILPQ